MALISRSLMPQIDELDLPQLVALAVQSGHPVAFEVQRARDLRSRQRVNHARALGMPRKVCLKPVITSSDGYIIDGNHRWFAHKQRKGFLNCICLGLTFDEALPWLFALPFVYRLTSSTPERN